MENEKITKIEQEKIFKILDNFPDAENKVKVNKQIKELIRYTKFKLRNELKTKIKEVLDEKN